ncbi:winged helix-turn-helix transcriptional regulator [Paraburkholderia solisilvae]|uniref:winged helix-turn-helix transcriptional regulator n=1 Tax=Paraburkholderia solisilvae TaxID=624376 RepID=UPI001C2EE3B6|nr:helix-turn-helix domain-containing protein [Paraburkholderia solisilvae]
MMRRTCLKNAKCPVARSLDTVGDWWTLLIVRDALKGACRFGEFQKSLGLAKNILSARLRTMVENGILELQPAADGSPHNEYHLTASGAQLQLVLVALRQWGERNLFEQGEPMMVMLDKESGQPVQRLQLTSQDGRMLTPADVHVKEGAANAPLKKSKQTRARQAR